MSAMSEREETCILKGNVQIDGAYLGGERPGGMVGRGSENKVPIVASLSPNQVGNPLYVTMSPVRGFTSEEIGI